MLVPMDTPCDEDETIDRIDNDDDFEVVTFPDSSANSFDVRETRCGLHQSSAIYCSAGSGFDSEG